MACHKTATVAPAITSTFQMRWIRKRNNQQHGGGCIIKRSYSPFIEFVCKPHLTTWLPSGVGDWKSKEKYVYSWVSGESYKMGVEEQRWWGDGERKTQSLLHAQVKIPPSCFFHPCNAGAGEFSCSVVSDSGGAVGDACGFFQGRESRWSALDRPGGWAIPFLSPLSRAKTKTFPGQRWCVLYLQGPVRLKVCNYFPIKESDQERG